MRKSRPKQSTRDFPHFGGTEDSFLIFQSRLGYHVMGIEIIIRDIENMQEFQEIY